MIRLVINWKKNILPFFGESNATAISHENIDRYIALRSASVSKETIRNELTIVRAILNWAVKRRLISSSPMGGYQIPKANYRHILPPSKKKLIAFVIAQHHTLSG